jgi:hypothetical protein
MMGRLPLCLILAMIAGACGGDKGGGSGKSDRPVKAGFITEPARGASSLAETNLTVDEFRFIDADTTMQDVIARVGAPGRDIGSGIHIYLYRLKDGTLMWIGSPDASEILYVRHVGRLPEESATLYERRPD